MGTGCLVAARMPVRGPRQVPPGEPSGARIRADLPKPSPVTPGARGPVATPQQTPPLYERGEPSRARIRADLPKPSPATPGSQQSRRDPAPSVPPFPKGGQGGFAGLAGRRPSRQWGDTPDRRPHGSGAAWACRPGHAEAGWPVRHPGSSPAPANRSGRVACPPSRGLAGGGQPLRPAPIQGRDLIVSRRSPARRPPQAPSPAPPPDPPVPDWPGGA